MVKTNGETSKTPSLSASETLILKAITELKDTMNVRMNSLEEQNKEILKDIKEKLNDVTIKFEHVSHEVTELKQQINYLEQQSFQADLVLTGLPEKPNENLITEIISIVGKLHLKVRESDIHQSFRMKNKKSSSVNSSILIRLNTMSAKQIILDKQKSAGPVLLQLVDSSLPSTDKRKLMFKDRLSKFNQGLLSDAHKVKDKFKFIWANCEGVFLRENSESKIHKVQSIHDINQLVSSFPISS